MKEEIKGKNNREVKPLNEEEFANKMKESKEFETCYKYILENILQVVNAYIISTQGQYGEIEDKEIQENILKIEEKLNAFLEHPNQFYFEEIKRLCHKLLIIISYKKFEKLIREIEQLDWDEIKKDSDFTEYKIIEKLKIQSQRIKTLKTFLSFGELKKAINYLFLLKLSKNWMKSSMRKIKAGLKDSNELYELLKELKSKEGNDIKVYDYKDMLKLQRQIESFMKWLNYIYFFIQQISEYVEKSEKPNRDLQNMKG